MKRRDFLAAAGVSLVGPSLLRLTEDQGEVTFYLTRWKQSVWRDDSPEARTMARRILWEVVERDITSLPEKEREIALACARHFECESQEYRADLKAIVYTIETRYGAPSWVPEEDA